MCTVYVKLAAAERIFALLYAGTSVQHGPRLLGPSGQETNKTNIACRMRNISRIIYHLGTIA
jgi:hypothetical protein